MNKMISSAARKLTLTIEHSDSSDDSSDDVEDDNDCFQEKVKQTEDTRKFTKNTTTMSNTTTTTMVLDAKINDSYVDPLENMDENKFHPPIWDEMPLSEIYDLLNPVTVADKKSHDLLKKNSLSSNGKQLTSLKVIGNQLIKALHEAGMMTFTSKSILIEGKKSRETTTEAVIHG